MGLMPADKPSVGASDLVPSAAVLPTWSLDRSESDMTNEHTVIFFECLFTDNLRIIVRIVCRVCFVEYSHQSARYLGFILIRIIVESSEEQIGL